MIKCGKCNNFKPILTEKDEITFWGYCTGFDNELARFKVISESKYQIQTHEYAYCSEFLINKKKEKID